MFQVFNKWHITLLCELLRDDDVAHMVLVVLQAIAEKRPDVVISFDDDLISTMRRKSQLGVAGGPILTALSKKAEVIFF